MERITEFSTAVNLAGEPCLQVYFQGAYRGLPKAPFIEVGDGFLVLCRSERDKILLDAVLPEDLEPFVRGAEAYVFETYGKGGTKEISYTAPSRIAVR